MRKAYAPKLTQIMSSVRVFLDCIHSHCYFLQDMLVLSDLHGASSVRALALKFIVENGKEIVAQNGWREKLKVCFS